MLEIKTRCKDCGKLVTVSLNKPISHIAMKVIKAHTLCKDCKAKYLKNLEN